MTARIEDYALIGDCETAALVSRQGSIDWLCWPRFDSDACFAALLGDATHGRWLIGPTEAGAAVSRRYQPGTMVLETRFETATGAVLMTDFMPPRGKASDIVRTVRGLQGQVDLRMELVLRFGYGAVAPWVTRLPDGRLRAIAGPDMVVLDASTPIHGEGLKTVAEFSLREGDTAHFVLTYAPSHGPPPHTPDLAASLAHTQAFWREWVSLGDLSGPYAAMVERSLLTLKALTYAPTGGVVAAPTTSLPEQFGGERNWDYRYCWVRDATLTLLALMDAGYYAEAEAWRNWLLRAVAGAPEEMQIMYGLGGERRLSEWQVDWLPGYADSRPVRVGNAAYRQLQIDVYGELMDALHQGRKGGLGDDPAAWSLQTALMTRLAEVWAEPDEGIWEIRGPRQRFTHSAVMAWVAADRAVRAVEEFGLPGPLDAWRALRDQISAEVWAHGYDARTGRFKRAFDDPGLDASLLLLAQVGFVPADHPAFRATVEAIERELMVDGYVLRYDTQSTDDGLAPGEGAFLACSFWLADAFVLLGRQGDAVALFERLLGLCNDLGLLAEEYDPGLRRLAGNFPQAFSHVGLVNTAFNLSRALKPAHERARTRSPAPRPAMAGRSMGGRRARGR